MTQKTFSDFKTLIERKEDAERIIAAFQQQDVHGNPRFNSVGAIEAWVKEHFDTHPLGNHTARALVFTGAKDLAGPHVIKFCTNDEIYMKFVNLLHKNRNLSAHNTLFPRIDYVYNLPDHSGAVVMEKLNMIDGEEKASWDKMKLNTKWFNPNVFAKLYFMYLSGHLNNVEDIPAMEHKLLTHLLINPRMLIEYFGVLKSLGAKRIDFSLYVNIARRDNKQFVIFDPLRTSDTL